MATATIDKVERQRQHAVRWGRKKSADVRDIGPIPPVKNPSRRRRCKKNLALFLRTYFPEAFSLPFSDDHDLLIRTLQDVIFDGGKVCVAMPRGSGKTTIMQRALLFSLAYGHARHAVLICADKEKYDRMTAGIREMVPHSDILLEDFPEIVHPIRSLEGSPQRQRTQTVEGELTHVRWSSSEMIFPTTKIARKRGNASATIAGGGLGGAGIRGSIHTTPWGEQIRPDLVLVDDPSTRSSAKSKTQNTDRELVIKSDVGKMAGPAKKISIMVACTVIYPDDLSERLMDHERSPDWEAIRVKMLKKLPKLDLWEKWYEIVRQESWGDKSTGAARRFYTKHQDEMDADAVHYWPERIEPGNKTAIESAMREYFQDRRVFMAEFQNEPEEAPIDGELKEMRSLDLVKRVNGYDRDVVPNDVEHLTCHVDCQLRMLYWMVCGFTPEFGCYIIDYGTWPEQHLRNFTYEAARKTLDHMYEGNDESGRLRAAIVDVVKHFSQKQWKRADGGTMQLSQGLIDGKYLPRDIEAALIQARMPNWAPAYGMGVRAKDKPLSISDPKRGRQGLHWIIQKPRDRDLVGVLIDTNWWKTEAHNALTVPLTHPEACSLYRHQPSHHQNLADQFCSERAILVTANGAQRDEWELRQKHLDNHWWDNLVGCFVGASVRGTMKQVHKHVNNRKTPPRRVYVRETDAEWE